MDITSEPRLTRTLVDNSQANLQSWYRGRYLELFFFFCCLLATLEAFLKSAKHLKLEVLSFWLESHAIDEYIGIN